MLVSPNDALFRLLKEDAERPGRHHVMHWVPEQRYLATMLAGHVVNLHCRYNFEPRIHAGTCCSDDWMRCEAVDIRIVHFSGRSPWELSSHDEVTCVEMSNYEPNQRIF